MSAFGDYYDNLPPDEQDKLDEIARSSILEFPRCPRDYSLVEAMLAWQRVEIDVMTAYADWLARTKAKFKRRGVEWTAESVMRYSRLWEVE